MRVVTYEGFVDESGQVRLLEQVQLPAQAKVFVVVPQLLEELPQKEVAHIYSPHLAHPEAVKDFRLQEVTSNDHAAL